jgi:hypothetical protein
VSGTSICSPAKPSFIVNFRAPRLASQSAAARSKGNDTGGNVGEPWAQESKDWVRSKAVGKTLRCVIDYEKYQTATGSLPAGTSAAEKNLNLRLYGTVRLVTGSNSYSSTSLSMALIGEGLATCIKYRNKDEPRSGEYDALVLEEATAAVKGKGLHSATAPPDQKLTDFSIDGKKAKAFLSLLQTKKGYRAVCEFVFSGSRMKVRVPSESAIFQFSLGQVSLLGVSTFFIRLSEMANRFAVH